MNDERPLLDLLPKAKAALGKTDSSETDFGRLRAVLDGTLGTDLETRIQLSHYMVLAFSYYNDAVSDACLSGWVWQKWLSRHRSRLAGIYSLNYDLNIERSLNFLQNNSYYYPGIRSPRVPNLGIPIVKPHGSINFGADQNVVIAGPPKLPLRIYISGSDLPATVLPDAALIQPRYAADIVLPTQISEYKNFQWVKPGYKLFETMRLIHKDIVVV